MNQPATTKKQELAVNPKTKIMNNTPTTTTKQELTTAEYSPSSLIQQAISSGLSVDGLEKLVALQERWEANQARKGFFEAFTRFQAKTPDIVKNKDVAFGQTSYRYATLASISRQLAPALEAAELSYRWEIQDDKDTIKVTCLVSHILGHTERTTMTGSPDASGSKNAIQARGSAIEYMKRYTLIGALGLTTTDTDDDARSSEYEYDMEKLHKNYMEVFNQVVTFDEKKYGPLHPDNWLIERTPKNYVKAIGDIRKILFDLQQKAKKQ